MSLDFEDYESVCYFQSDYTDRFTGIVDFSIDYLDELWAWRAYKPGSECYTSEKVLNNAIDFYKLLITYNKLKPDSIYSNLNGCVVFDWDCGPGLGGSIEIGATRWLLTASTVKTQI